MGKSRGDAPRETTLAVRVGDITFGRVAGLIFAVPAQVFILQPRDVRIIVVVVLL